MPQQIKNERPQSGGGRRALRLRDERAGGVIALLCGSASGNIIAGRGNNASIQ